MHALGAADYQVRSKTQFFFANRRKLLNCFYLPYYFP
jgi:hypothetical protein